MDTAAGAFLSPADFAARLADPEAGEDFSPLGSFPIIFIPITENDRPLLEATLPLARLAIHVGVDHEGALPRGLEACFDILLTTAPDAPRPWVSARDGNLTPLIASLHKGAMRSPFAASALAQVLRFGENLPVKDALALESFAYSALLGGEEFRNWRTQTPKSQRPTPDRPLVRLAREENRASLTMDFPETRNAFRARMRDEYIEGLRVFLLDPDIAEIHIHGEGPSFCSGGDLGEFGSASDVARAHAIRTQRSAALLVHEGADRIIMHLHGVCVGAGIEVSAAAGTILAAPGTWLRLPEVAMGLIPGAGGTATIPRRIGRHRACYMGLSSSDIDCDTALAWGLVDRVTAP